MKTASQSVKLLFFSITILIISIFTTSVAYADSAVSGWAWSSNIGWVDLNSTNDTDPATAGVQKSTTSFGVDVSSVTPGTTGTMSGFAWSSNIGWISFNNTGCPSTGCTAGASIVWAADGTGVMKGWARACSVYVSGCSGATKDVNGTELGGWDGFISLAPNATDGVKIKADGTMTGYAWGSEVVGWVDFSGATVSIAKNQCNDGIDNSDPEDVLADSADPGCHSDGNASNGASYVPTDNDETDAQYECNDGVDNSDPEDVLVDSADPGCHTDGDPTNTATYILTDNDEKNNGSYQCNDGVDNADTEDVIADYPNDPGCTSAVDNDETNTTVLPQCSDGIDNSDPEDTKADQNDPGCYSGGVYNPNDDDETNSGGPYQCSDGVDNADAEDTLADYPNDPGCTSPVDNDETDGAGSCTPADNLDPTKKSCYCAVPANKTKAACKIKPVYIESR